MLLDVLTWLVVACGLAALAILLRLHRCRPRLVGAITVIKTVRETEGECQMDLITKQIKLPRAIGQDVRELAVSVDFTEGADAPQEYALKPGTTDMEIEGPQGATARIRVVAVDDVGNRSEPVEADIQFVDDLPPVLEGEIAVIRTVRERTVDDVDEPPTETPNDDVPGAPEIEANEDEDEDDGNEPF